MFKVVFIYDVGSIWKILPNPYILSVGFPGKSFKKRPRKNLRRAALAVWNRKQERTKTQCVQVTILRLSLKTRQAWVCPCLNGEGK